MSNVKRVRRLWGRPVNPPFALLWFIFFSGSMISSVVSAMNQTDGPTDPVFYFMILLAIGSVFGAAIAFDRIFTKKANGLFGNIVVFGIMIFAVLCVTVSSHLDYVQISTIWERGETDKDVRERVESRNEASVGALQKLSASATSAEEAARKAWERAEEEFANVQKLQVTPPVGRLNLQALQSRLNEAGYDPGKIDGTFGPATQAALSQYVQDLRQAADEAKAAYDAKQTEAADAALSLANASQTATEVEDEKTTNRSITRKAMITALPEQYGLYGRDTFLAFLFTLVMNLGASLAYAGMWDDEEEGEDIRHAPVYSQHHMDQMLGLLGDGLIAKMSALQGGSGQVSWSTSVQTEQQASPPQPFAAPEVEESEAPSEEPPRSRIPDGLRSSGNDFVSNEAYQEWNEYEDGEDHIDEISHENVSRFPKAPRRGAA